MYVRLIILATAYLSEVAQVRPIVTLAPVKQGISWLKLRLLNFDPYPSRTHSGPWVTLVAILTEQCLNFETMEMIGL